MEDWKARRDRIRTIEMLLDATWAEGKQLFVKRVTTHHANGMTSHWDHYYNEHGVEVGIDKKPIDTRVRDV